MACKITNGVSKDCAYSFGGLDKIYLANRVDISAITYDINGTITGVTMVAPETFYEFQFEKGTGSFNQELQITAGGRYFTQVVNFTVNGLDQSRMNLMEELGLANIVAICLDKRGKAFVLGINGGLEAATLTANSGAAESDALAMTVSLSGASTQIGPEIDTTIIAGLL